MKTQRISLVFCVIIVGQFCGTSLWFAGNASVSQLRILYAWPVSAAGHLAGAVQLGFILGTLAFSLLAIADRFSPSRVFFICCLAGAASNVAALLDTSSLSWVLTSRACTGFFLAGIYPVGMKIAADWKAHGLGNWLGALVGALVLGTAFPQALKLMPQFVDVHSLLAGVSLLAVSGGLIVWILVPDGPYRRPGKELSFSAIRNVFQIPAFRASALGYFGHMWELYAFWAFVPWAISFYFRHHVQPPDARYRFCLSR